MSDARKRAEEALAAFDKAFPLARVEAAYDCAHALRALLAETAPAPPQAREVEEAAEFARICRDYFDHDSDAHKYGTFCRCCEADKLLAALARGGVL